MGLSENQPMEETVRARHAVAMHHASVASGRPRGHGATQVTSENIHKKIRLIFRGAAWRADTKFLIRLRNNSENSSAAAFSLP
jgi:hypothetical protein